MDNVIPKRIPARIEEPGLLRPFLPAVKSAPQAPVPTTLPSAGEPAVGCTIVAAAQNWRPDWRNESMYPDPEKTTRLQWAWEFLRRNPEYQQLWSARIAPKYDPVHVDISLERIGPNATTQPMTTRVRTPLNEHGGFHDLRPFRDRFRITTVRQNPSESEAKVRFDAQFIRYADGPMPRGPRNGIPTTLHECEALVWFDLQLPLDAQLQNAKELLSRLLKQKQRTLKNIPFSFRCRSEKYPRYLRLLDAKTAASADSEVAKVIYPRLSDEYPDYFGRHRVREDRAAAERLRDSPWCIAVGKNTK